MKFTKVNKNTIRCQMSREEMSARGIELNDIMDDRGKAEAFLRDILTEAKTALNFEMSGEALNVQLSVMKNGNVTIQISDDKNARIRQLLKELQERVLAGNSLPAEDVIDIPPDTAAPGGAGPLDFVSRAGADDIVEMHLWAVVPTMENCIAMAHVLAESDHIETSLYRFKDACFLEFDLKQKKSQIAKTIFTISEFSDKVFSDDGTLMEIREHGKRLIEGDAIERLAAL